jgi:hypothetical protein
LGWSYVPKKSALHKTGNIVRTVHLDENGIRVPNKNFNFEYDKPTILFIGGSFTMGHGLSYEESFVGKFDAEIGNSYQIANLGVQGYGSDQTLIALKKYLSKFNTKIVVYTFIEDHIFRNGNYDRRMLVPTAKFLGTKPQFALNSNKELYLARKPLLYSNYIQSYLVDFIKMRIGTLMGSSPPYPEELTKNIIQEMRKYSNEHGADFVVLNWRWTDNNYDIKHEDLNIDIIDTLQNAPDGWKEMILLKGIHPNAESSEHVVRLLMDYFQEKDILLNYSE